jgi:hypothetical protein
LDAGNPKRRSSTPLAGEKIQGIADAFIAPGGEGFVSAGRLYRFDTGKIAGEARADGGGWLGSQWQVR